MDSWETYARLSTAMPKDQVAKLLAEANQKQGQNPVIGTMTDPQFWKDMVKGVLTQDFPKPADTYSEMRQAWKGDPSRRLNQVLGVAGMAPLAATVWHAGPRKFAPTAKNPLGEFDASKIGTGEGAQAYGYGHYTAENPRVARQYNPYANSDITSDVYRKNIAYWEKRYAEEPTARVKAELDAVKAKLSNNAEQNKIYKVDLPDEQIAKMLDWDKPLSQQSAMVQKALKEELEARIPKFEAVYRSRGVPEGKIAEITKITRDNLLNGTGANYVNNLGKGAEASEFLKSLGIPGIRYLDQGSRATGKGTYNYVVFPGGEDALKILGRE